MSSPPTVASRAPAERRPLWLLGLIGGAIAAVGNVILYLLYQISTGAPLQVSTAFDPTVADLPIVMPILYSVVPGLLAAPVVAGLTRWTRNPRAWFIGISAIVTALSFFTPMSLPVSTANQLVLALMHIVAAVAIVGVLLPRIPTRPA